MQAMAQPLAGFFEQVSQLTPVDVYNGFRSVMFGGTNEVKPFPFRGTRNKWEDANSTFYWRPDGTFNVSPDQWWLERTMTFMSVHYEIPFFLALFYLVLIFSIQKFLKNPVTWLNNHHFAAWNLLLTIFSVAGTITALPAMYNYIVVLGNDIGKDVCLPFPEYDNYWTFLFCLSKIPELFDTLFLVLKKKPVIFLHWYHHIATMIYCWDAWATVVPQGGFFATMNLFVHSIMYGYYFIMSRPFGIQFKIPTAISFFITSLQVCQMFGGLSILYYAINNCATSQLTNDFRLQLNLVFGVFMYLSYAILFLKFMIERYFSSGQKKQV